MDYFSLMYYDPLLFAGSFSSFSAVLSWIRLAFLDIEVGGTDLLYKNVKKGIDDKNLKQWKIKK